MNAGVAAPVPPFSPGAFAGLIVASIFCFGLVGVIVGWMNVKHPARKSQATALIVIGVVVIGLSVLYGLAAPRPSPAAPTSSYRVVRQASAYIDSISAAYRAFTPRRFNLEVGVSMSESGSHSSPTSTNFLICSTWANWRLTSSTPRCTSAMTSGSAASSGSERPSLPWVDAQTRAESASSTRIAEQNFRASPMAAAWPMSGIVFSAASRFAGLMFLPPEVMISSFFRSTMRR